jgi:hypothetical protein
MINEKEQHLNQYYQFTIALLDALVHGRVDDVNNLLEHRENCILAIGKIDEAAGTILMNDRIRQLLQEQLSLEQEVRKEFQLTLTKLSGRIRIIENKRFLTKLYEDSIPVSKGVFYDIKK